MGSPRRAFFGPEGPAGLVEKLREAMIGIGRRSAGETFGSDLQKQCQRATVELGNLVVMLTDEKDPPLQNPRS
jgi:hypothetical protein